MKTSLRHQSVPVTIRLCPSTLQTMMFDSKRRGLTLSRWFEDAVNAFCAFGDDLDAPSEIPRASPAVVGLFAQMLEHSPELLPAAWSTFEKLVRGERSVWVYPTMTVGQLEDGEPPCLEPYLDRAALTQAWPMLAARAASARLDPRW